MKSVHVNDLNGRLVWSNNKLILITIGANDNGSLTFDFVDPFTDKNVAMTDNEARQLLIELMFDPFDGGVNE
ncbi:hypothetical protein J4G57_05440 [Aeromonas caviae]|uniref:hypothetical protein n=1 Tax=Aeromonas TaxID=642 RepID=UPI000F7A98DE|nr:MULTISPECIES: hypothetical protein [Aeromonas]MBS4707337.1 hypothetical protein [Aeromonas caviae]RSM32269.1 hypothetical protein C5B78_00885 [Aeromonas salmonicida]